MKVEFQLRNGQSVVCELLTSTHITQHFQLFELANNKGTSVKPQFIINDEVDLFLLMLEEFRTWFAKPMTCNSMYRQPAFNKSVGGSSNSLHLKALAFDWGIKGHNEKQRENVLNKWKQICEKYQRVGGINFYTNGYHLDAFEDKFGAKTFVFRDYRGKAGDW